MAFLHDYMDVAVRRPGGPTLRGRAMQRDAAFRSDVSARCGVPIRRFGQLPNRFILNPADPSQTTEFNRISIMSQ